MSQPLVSIIVPAHNIENYIDRCVASIVAQTHTNIEILLVDDGSTDGTGSRCDLWQQRDRRISVIHKPCGGPGDARNAAIGVATGQYLSFVDGDDCIAPTLVAELLDIIADTDADIAVCGHITFSGAVPTTPPCKSSDKSAVVMQRDEAILDVFYQHRISNSPCGRIFKACIWKSLRFSTSIIYEDLAIIYQLFMSVDKVAVTDRNLYFYFIRPDSIIGHFTASRLDVLTVLESLTGTVSSKYRRAVQSRLLSASFNILGLMPHDMPGRDAAVQRCWHNISTLRLGCFFNRRVRLKNKLGILLSLLGKNALAALLPHIVSSSSR